MKRRRSRCRALQTAFSCLAVLLLGAGLSVAQLSQTGNLDGAVSDPEGLALPGVTVTLSSPALITSQMTGVTNEKGRYRFPSLPPGAYEVKFELDGFNTLIRKAVRINVGKTVTLDASLDLRTVEASITVVGDTPVMDRDKTTKTTVLDSDFLNAVPAVRTLTNYFNMTPGVTAEAAHGSSVRDNTYNLDGVNLSDPVVGTQGVFFGMDIMEEVSIQQGGLSAEYGSVRGAVVNAVSKSGGNKFSGTASMYYRNENLQSDNTKGTPLEGSESGFKSEIEPGVYIGGPVLKDKVWFFANMSFNKREEYVAKYPYDGPEVPVDDMRPYPYIKTTFQPDRTNRFTFSYNYSDIRRNHRGANQYQSVDTTFKQVTPTHVLNAQWTRMFDNDFFMDAKFGYYNQTFNMLKKNDLPNITENTTSFESGSSGYDDLYQRDRLQINSNGNYFLDDVAGSHELKFGGEFQYAWSSRALEFGRDPRNGMSFITTYNGAPWYGWTYDELDTKENMMNFAAFLQDTWNPADDFTLNLGLRFEHNKGIIPPQNEEEGPQTFLGNDYNRSVTDTMTPLSWTTLAPRVGAIYDLSGNGTTLLKASFSRYYMANITQWFSMNNPNGFFYYGSMLNPDWSAGSVFSFSLPGQTEVGYGGKGLKSPYLDELAFGVERELTPEWSVGLRYIKKWDRNLIEDVDANALDIERLLNEGVLDWTNYVQVFGTDPFDGSQVEFWNRVSLLVNKEYLVNPPGAERNYDGVELTFNKRFSDGYQLWASYVWQDSTGLIGTDFGDSWGGSSYFNNPNTHVNAVGRFLLERRHQFKIQGLYKGPWGINTSAYFRYLSGRRYTRQVRSQDVGLSLAQSNVTVNAEERGARGLPALHYLDLRFEKVFRIQSQSVSVFLDAFNLFNDNQATGVRSISSNPSQLFEEMTGIQDPRMIRMGAKFSF